MDKPKTPVDEIVTKLKSTNLFDAGYYLEKNPDVKQAQIDPCLHYVVAGEREGRMPCRLFDPRWYQSLYGVDPAETNIFLHYLTEGERAGLMPSPLFDPVYVRSTYGLTQEQSALAYFMSKHLRQQWNPNGVFDTQQYLALNPDVKASPLLPYFHFLDFGIEENRAPRNAFNWTHVRSAFPSEKSNLEVFSTVCAFAQMTKCVVQA